MNAAVDELLVALVSRSRLAVIDAVLLTVPEETVGPTTPLTVKSTLPPAGRLVMLRVSVAPVARGLVPEGHVAPPLAAHVTAGVRIWAGMTSVRVTVATGPGPLLATVMV